MPSYNITLLPSPLVSSGEDQAFDLNNEGIAVGSAENAGELPVSEAPARGKGAVRWTPNPTLLAPFAPIDEISCAYGINSVGHIVGGTGKSIPEGQAFLYKSGFMYNLASLLNTVANPAEQSKAKDINDAGVIVGDAGRINRLNAFRYDSETPTAPENLGALPGDNMSSANAINGKRQVTGISWKESGPYDPHAFLYDDGLIDLGPADFANDINDAGQVVGARKLDATSRLTAYLCDTSSRPPQFTNLHSLALPGFVGAIAWGINTRGDIVGDGHIDVGVGVVQTSRAWVRPAGGRMQDLNSLIPPSSGWLLTTAQAINDKGLIVGTGAYLGGSQAYLLTPAPEPSGFSWPWSWLQAIINRLGNIFGGGP